MQIEEKQKQQQSPSNTSIDKNIEFYNEMHIIHVHLHFFPPIIAFLFEYYLFTSKNVHFVAF